MANDLIAELAKAKLLFQQRAILAAMGVRPEQIQAAKSDAPSCRCVDAHEAKCPEAPL